MKENGLPAASPAEAAVRELVDPSATEFGQVAERHRETSGGERREGVDGFESPRRGVSPARLKILGMLGSAVAALGAALAAARSGATMFDAWYWMPVVWGGVVLVGVVVGIVRDGLPDESRPTHRPPGDPKSHLKAVVARWRGVRLPTWHRATGAVATISSAIAGAAIAVATGEVFLGMPLSWWAIGMALVAGIGTFELLGALRQRKR